jgi:formate dehydrogenase maturation protein FdhE
MAIDWQKARSLWIETVAIFKKHAEAVSQDGDIRFAPVPAIAALEKICRAWYEGAEPAAQIAKPDSDGSIASALVHAVMRPFLIVCRDAVQSLFDPEAWRRNYCPVCAGSPDFGFLEKEVGAKWLLCSRCDMQWAFQRMECPYCGNKDQNTLSYFMDDMERYRMYVCEECHHYLKTVDLRKREDEVLLPLERFLTIEQDEQALKEGYVPASGMHRHGK